MNYFYKKLAEDIGLRLVPSKEELLVQELGQGVFKLAYLSGYTSEWHKLAAPFGTQMLNALKPIGESLKTLGSSINTAAGGVGKTIGNKLLGMKKMTPFGQKALGYGAAGAAGLGAYGLYKGVTGGNN